MQYSSRELTLILLHLLNQPLHPFFHADLRFPAQFAFGLADVNIEQVLVINLEHSVGRKKRT